MDFRVELLSHGQMLEISDALITKPRDQSTQNRRVWNLLPYSNRRAKSYFEPRNVNKENIEINKSRIEIVTAIR